MHDVLDDLRASFAGQYEIERELTGGGMSRLFLATERVLGRQVVIKVLPPELTSAVGAARFRRETEVTARLQHPNILPILSAGAQGRLLYYVMPFVAGESLRARMTREGAFPVAEALRLMVEVADALACAHDAGVIHRDIKPENVLLQSGHALLADFGVAAALSGDGAEGATGETKLTRTGTSPGTVGYMAPEQLASEGEVDARADVYSLGVVAWEVIAGRKLFEADSGQALLVAHLVDEPESLDVVRFDVPGHVARTIEKALSKKPADRWQTAAELRDALQRSLAAVQSAEGGIERDPLGRRMKVAVRRLRSSMTTQRMTVPHGVAVQDYRRRWILSASAVLVIGAAVLGWVIRNSRAAAPTDDVMIAVAPFRVLSSQTVPELELWREGIVDVMSSYLDGAGTIHTISPKLVLSRSATAVEQRDAADFAKNLGAQYALVGQFTPTSGNGVSARMWLVDASDVVVHDTTWRLPDVRMAADSMSLRVVREIGRRHRIAATDNATLAGSHLSRIRPTALRDYLRGEQFYRRTAWDSALVAYQNAVNVDSTFALPSRRIALVREWEYGSVDSVARSNALRAGRFARGLSRRDSLLVTADSVAAALNASHLTGSPVGSLLRRLFSILDRAQEAYRNDPEVWYAVAEARFHHGYGRVSGVTERSALDAFNRAIALDSSFAPAYVHAVELAYTLDGPAAARRRTVPYLALDPTDQHAEAIRLLDRLIDPARAGDDSTRALLDSLPFEVLRRSWFASARANDSIDVGQRLLSTMDRRLRRNDANFRAEFARLRSYSALQYAYRGRFAEAYASNGERPTALYVELAMLGAIPTQRADSSLRAWVLDSVAQRGGALRSALTWWGRLGDRASLDTVRQQFERRRDAARTPQQARAYAITVARAQAYLALASRDTAEALRRFATVPDTSCLSCYLDRLELGRIHAAQGRLASADSLLQERLYTLVSPMEVIFALERGKVSARLGKVDVAREALQKVIRTWGGEVDPIAQQFVRQAMSELATLSSTSPQVTTRRDSTR